jgi:hypothetical protein
MKSNSVIFLIITALILAGGAYWYFSNQAGGNEPPLTGNIQENQTQTQFKTLVSQLQSISFDPGIFSDPHFIALTDLATPVTPEESGRKDPFAPLPGVSVKQ